MSHWRAHLAVFGRAARQHPGRGLQALLAFLAYWRKRGFRILCDRCLWKLSALLAVTDSARCPVCRLGAGMRRLASGRFGNVRKWFAAYRPTARLLDEFRRRDWPPAAPGLTVLMPVYETPETWLRQAIDSVRAQTYDDWELICIDDCSRAPHVAAILVAASREESRIRILTTTENGGVAAALNRGLAAAGGDYICFLDHDDVLEPHALHCLADAILSQQPDLLYTDEVLTTTDIDDPIEVLARPTFSYHHYLGHPYFVHLVCVRRGLTEQVGGFNESMQVSHDVDFVLRIIEQAQVITHVAAVVYRWRQHQGSLGHVRQALVDSCSTAAVERHLARTGQVAALAVPAANFRDLCYPLPAAAKVAIIIPSRDQADYLRRCIDSLEATVADELADLIVVDHQSTEPQAVALLAELASRHCVLPYAGTFNFSAICNDAVRRLPRRYDFYLFLNNDTEARDPGWLAHMVGLCAQPRIGIVGAMLLYADESVQHAGVIVGLGRSADHAARYGTFYRLGRIRHPGYNGCLCASHEVSAVTAACMLVSREAFAAVDGFDESLAVGYGDTDLCLRAGAAGYGVLMDAHAVLLHYESVSRGRGIADPHPEDSRLFGQRYAALMSVGDPYYSPLLTTTSTGFELNPAARATADFQVRTVTQPGAGHHGNAKPLAAKS